MGGSTIILKTKLDHYTWDSTEVKISYAFKKTVNSGL